MRMRYLIEKGLMFGNLFHVSSAALVERYNRALHDLSRQRTELTDFYIDISGYSPEVGHELGDDLYLNHGGVNRQFILLSPEQKRCPLLNAKFSTSHGILRAFIEENEAALFALTARDAVAGELVNSIYDINDPQNLLNLRAIQIEADTTTRTVQSAEALGDYIDDFLTKEDAWFDDVLIGRMISLATETGDVTRNPVHLKRTTFEQQNYWTAHFGGLYLFQNAKSPAALVQKPLDIGLPTILLEDCNAIARWLLDAGLIEPILQARGIDASAILRQKMDFILVDAMTSAGIDLKGTTRRDLRRLARQNTRLLPEEYYGLADLVNWAENGGEWPKISSEHPAYFYSVRASNHADAALVNMLLAQLAPKDVRQLFICHKPMFYDEYAKWPEAKQAYVADYLAAEYHADKQGTREALFGHDSPMEPPETQEDDLIARVGPWGAVRR